jgi:hypothetical protein
MVSVVCRGAAFKGVLEAELLLALLLSGLMCCSSLIAVLVGVVFRHVDLISCVRQYDIVIANEGF